MAGSISVGQVTVFVVPTTKGIEKSMRDQLVPPASKVGDEMGKTVGDKVKAKVSESVGDGVTEGGQKAKAPAAKVGDDVGKSIGDQVKAKVSDSVGDGVTEGGQKAKAPATTVGDEVGKTIGDKIKKPVEDSIPDGLGAGGKKSEAPAKQQGSKVGGAFADAFKDRLKTALASLPQVTLGADSTDADRRVDELRTRLTELSNKRIGVDIDAAAALAQMAEIRSQLRELARGGDVGVRVDAVRAIAELDAVRGEVDRLGASDARPSVSIDGSGALSTIRTIASAMAALSAGPVLAVGGLAAAGLGIGGGAAGLGLGATAAASAPGITAVKAAYTAQAAAATAAADATANTGAADAAAAGAAKQAAQQSLALAGAQQQLAAAQRQAQYDRQQATEQVTSAEQQLTSAEQGVAQAQQASLAAQKAVNDARKQAKQDLEDLNNQVKDASLSQRADQLALEQATQQLQAVQSNPQATEQQREQAQLTYDQAVQQLAEQGIAYQRLQDQAAAANTAGIDGSQAVVSAQQQVTQAAQQQQQAQQQLTNAQQQLADARQNVARVELNSADQIASAQRALASAQLQSATASGASGGAAATAAAKAKAAYDALTPSEKAVYNATLGLSTAFKAWGQSLEPSLAPLAVTGMGAIQKLLPLLTPAVTGAAGAMQTLENKAVSALGSPVWRTFIADVGREAGPALLGFGNAAENLANGARGIIEAVLPYAPQMIGFLDSATGKIGTWGSSLGTSSGFHQFIAYVQANGPQVVHTVEEFAQAAGHVAADLAPLGPIALTVNGTIIRLVGALAQSNPGLVQWGVGLGLAFRAAGPVVNVSKSLIGGDTSGIIGLSKAFKSGGDEGSKLGGVLVKAKGWLGSAAGDAAEAAKGGWGAFTGVLGTAGSNASALGGTLSGKAKGWLSSAADSASQAAKGGWGAFTGVLGTASDKAGLMGSKLLLAGESAATAVNSGLAKAGTAIADGAGAAATAAVNVGRAGAAWFITGVKAAGSGIAIAASTTATVAASAATKAWTIVQAAFNVVMDANPIVLVTLAIAALVAGVVIAYKNSATFRDIVHDTWHVIGDVVQGTWRDVIKPVFDFFASGVRAIPGAVEDAVHGMDTAWNKVKGVFATPVNFVIQTVYDEGIAGLWNAVVSHIGLSSIKLPIIAPLKFAAGGQLPALGPGPAVVSSPRAIVGEGDPRWPEYVIPTDPRYRARARTLHAAAGVQLLASGGIVGDFETGLLTSASFVAKLITDPGGAWRQAAAGVLGLTNQIGGGDWGALLGGVPGAMIDKLAGYIGGFAHSIATVGAALLGDIHGGHDVGAALGSIKIPGVTYTAPSAGHGALAYDSGGRLPTGITLAYNGTGRPERVLTDAQWTALAATAHGGDGGSRTTNITVHSPAASAEAVAAETARRLAFAGIS